MKNFILLAMVIATSNVVGAQAPNYIPSEGLAGWWPLDGNALDGGSFENHGTINGAVETTNRHDEASSALAFDGVDDHIVIPDAPSLQITGDITVTVWYLTPGPSGGYQTFLTKRTGGQWPYSFGLSHYYGNGGCPGELDKYITGRRNNSSQYDLRVTEKTYVSNQWTHAAMTIENDVVTFYENGVPIGSTCFGDEFFVTAIDQGAPLTFGTCNCGLPEMMTGSLDDIGIWSRALSPEEINSVFQSIEIVEGCTDPDACNFDSDANQDNNSCAYGCTECGEGTTWNPSTLICEAAQSCDTIYTPDYDSDGFIGLSDILGILSVYGQAWPPFDCGNPVEYQGYQYETVQIGEQCWFAENSRYIPFVNAPSDLSNTEPKYYVWENSSTDLETATSSAEYIERGVLYNQPAAMNACPQGWKLPSKEDFIILSEVSGGDDVAGMNLMSINSGGNDIWGFQLEVTGYLNDQGLWLAPERANLWSSSPDPSNSENALYRYTSINDSQFIEIGNRLRAGKAVRCIKDAE